MKWIKRVGLGVLATLGLLLIGFVVWAQVNRYPAQLDPSLPAASTAPIATSAAPQDWYIFVPSAPADRGFIFYPGGLVDADAYSWLGQQLAQHGILTVIVPMPLDLAVLSPNRAEDVLKAYPDIPNWAIGGHSLGGSMAGQYLASRSQASLRVKGLVLWGARLTAGIDVSALPIKVVSIYGTRDGIAPPGLSDEQRLAGLPSTTRLVPITGGNHSMFGDYGLQKGDNPLTIPLDQARQQIIAATLSVFEK